MLINVNGNVFFISIKRSWNSYRLLFSREKLFQGQDITLKFDNKAIYVVKKTRTFIHSILTTLTKLTLKPQFFSPKNIIYFH